MAGSALVVGVAVRQGNPIDRLGPLLTSGENEQLLNAWVKVDADNIVTAVIPHVEMGQGVYTALAQMLADEMELFRARSTAERAPVESVMSRP